MSVNVPAKYVGAPLEQPSADAGSCRLTPTSAMVRPFQPIIRGGRRRHRKTRKHHKKSRKHTQKGGFFLPSIGESFAAAAANYVAPLALYGIYKFATRKKSRR
jgi:hypothetical protein